LEDSRIVGLLAESAVERVPPHERKLTPVGKIMRDVETVGPDDDLGRALQALSAHDVALLPVVQEGAMIGILKRSDVLRGLKLQELEASQKQTSTYRPDRPIHVELSVARLQSGNALFDGELQHRLEGRKFPRVIGEAREITSLEKSQFRVRADLTLHGVTRSLQVQAAMKILDPATLQIEGEQVIDLRDFGVDPPKLLFLRVEPRVRVYAAIVAQRKSNAVRPDPAMAEE